MRQGERGQWVRVRQWVTGAREDGVGWGGPHRPCSCAKYARGRGRRCVFGGRAVSGRRGTISGRGSSIRGVAARGLREEGEENGDEVTTGRRFGDGAARHGVGDASGDGGWRWGAGFGPIQIGRGEGGRRGVEAMGCPATGLGRWRREVGGSGLVADPDRIGKGRGEAWGVGGVMRGLGFPGGSG